MYRVVHASNVFTSIASTIAEVERMKASRNCDDLVEAARKVILEGRFISLQEVGSGRRAEYSNVYIIPSDVMEDLRNQIRESGGFDE